MADEMKLRYTTEVDTSGAVKGMADVEKVVGNTGKKAEGTGKQLKGMVQEMAPAKLKAFINPMTAATATIGALSYGAIQATKDFAKFQSQLSKVNTLLKVSKSELNNYGEEILRVSRVTGMAKEQIGEGLYQALSAGVSSEDSMKFMEIATKTAIAGFTDVNTAVDGLTTVINAYKLETSAATEIADKFLTIQKNGKITVNELGKSMGTILPIAAAMGVSLDDIGGALSTMTANGVPASEATTQLRQAISQLSNGTTNAAKTFQKLTGKTFPDFIKGGGTLAEAFNQMRFASDATGKSMGELMGSVEAAGAIFSTTGLNAEKMAANVRDVKEGIGELKTAYELATDNIESDWKKLVSSLDTMWKNMVKGMETPIRFTIQTVNGVVKILNGDLLEGSNRGKTEDEAARRRAWQQEAIDHNKNLAKQGVTVGTIDIKNLEEWLNKREEQFQKELSEKKKEIAEWGGEDPDANSSYTPLTDAQKNFIVQSENERLKKEEADRLKKEAAEKKAALLKQQSEEKALYTQHRTDMAITKAEFDTLQYESEAAFMQQLSEMRASGKYTEKELEAYETEYKFNKFLEEQEFKLAQLETDLNFYADKEQYAREHAETLAEIARIELSIEEEKGTKLKKLKDQQAKDTEEAARKMREVEYMAAEGMADAANLLIAGQIKGLDDLTKYLTGKLLVTVAEAAGQVTTQALTMEALAKALLATPGMQGAGAQAQAAAAFNWATIPKIMAVKMISGIGQAMMSTASTSSGSGGSSGGFDSSGTTSTDKSEIAKEDNKEKFLEINTDRRDILAALLPDLDQAMKDGYNIRLIPKS